MVTGSKLEVYNPILSWRSLNESLAFRATIVAIVSGLVGIMPVFSYDDER